MAPSKWTKEACSNFAQQCTCWADFYNTSAYAAAFRYGWLREVAGHLMNWPTDQIHNKGRTKYTKERCYQVAKRFSTRAAFKAAEDYCYKVSVRKGWLEDVCEHMVYGHRQCNCVYIWRIKGTELYKVGVSLMDRAHDRIRDCATANAVEAEVLFIKPRRFPRRTERAIVRRYGVDGKAILPKDGWTEVIRKPSLLLEAD